uniref:High-affnity carbon uptake protein Hat/HatR n=1 Tax=uncultured Thiotrichaceae bacterium TaxID=298394 RepID=A0A6S6TE70_9GAMM|nr:MAG: High-affnity carbon uptake protein Hat/HatR [uncultured Thiotrichaceae bacterium]
MSTAPYSGLRPFLRDETDIFFGRENQVDELLEKLQTTHFLAVIGASGCGKSSLVKAGLLPGLDSGYMGLAGANWSIVEMYPGDTPFANLSTALLVSPVFRQLWEGEDHPAQIDPNQAAFLHANLRRSPNCLNKLLQTKALPDSNRLLILIDQFEEIFRFNQLNDNEATAFIALILEASKHPDVYVVITMRSDFLGNAAVFSGLPEAINNGMYLTPRLTRDQLWESIAFPAQVFGGETESKLVNHLLNEAVNTPDELPLLQHALMHLWDNDQDKLITLAEYKKLNGLKGCFNTHLEQVWNDLDPTSQHHIVEIIFRSLVETNQEGNSVRHPCKAGHLALLANCSTDEVIAVIEHFRLPGRNFLTPSMPTQLNENTVIDISHESLIRQWGRLQQWTAQEHKKSEVYYRLQAATKRYQQQQTELWTGTDLAIAKDWLYHATPDEHWAKRYEKNATFEAVNRFLQDSIEQETQYQEMLEARRKKEITQSRKLAGLTTVGLIIALMLAIWGGIERNRAETSEHQRTGELFTSYVKHAALEVKTEKYSLAKQLLKQSYQLNEDIPAPRQYSRDLLAAYVTIAGGEAGNTFTRIKKQLFDIGISADKSLIAAVGENGVFIYQRANGQLQHLLSAHQGDVYSVQFHPDKPVFYSAGIDGKIFRWHFPKSSDEPEATLYYQTDQAIHSLAISPDGKTLAVNSKSGATDLLDTLSGRLLHAIGASQQESGLSSGITFSHNSKYIANASFDGNIRVWNVATGLPLGKWHAHSGKAYSVAFSPDDKHLAAGLEDNSINLWSLDDGRLVNRFKGHTNGVLGIRFFHREQVTSHNNKTDADKQLLLASGSRDNTIRIWDVASARTVRVLEGHTGAVVNLLTVTPENKLYSVSNDGTVKEWSTQLPHQWLVDLEAAAFSAAISPDGQKAIVGLGDGSLQIYDLKQHRVTTTTPQLHPTAIKRITFNNDSTVATASTDGTVKVWDLVGNELRPIESYHTGTKLHSVDIAPNQDLLATAGLEGHIKLLEWPEVNLSRDIEAHNGTVASVQFDATGTRLLSSGNNDHRLKLWDITDKNHSLISESHVEQSQIHWATLSPDGSRIASVGRENAVNIYNAETMQLLLTLNGHQNSLYRAFFTPNNKQLFTVSMDGTVRVWDLEIAQELFSLKLPVLRGHNDVLYDFSVRCQSKGCWVLVPFKHAKKFALYYLETTE